MQALVTKYLGPTNYRDARVKATAEAGSVTLSWDHALDVTDNHDAAAMALVRKMGWDKDCYPNRFYRGGLPQNNSHAYVYVFAADHCEVTP